LHGYGRVLDPASKKPIEGLFEDGEFKKENQVRAFVKDIDFIASDINFEEYIKFN